ncbi:MAG: sulfoxide reductase heme-binding subunit YedZ [Chromatiales bacterium]|jgi:sulfoxide reductase heme-binding subunit YedZ|nr:MAG: sulfoxide reductase heme-binding subunit YedZ [Chromatiales bacterium]
MNTLQQIRYVWKPVVFLLCLIPATLVLTDAFEITGQLGANPIEEIQDRFGNWALRFIMITLAVTPLRRTTGWNWLSGFRRMLGLFTFFYALMHFLIWLILDRELRLSDILEDLTERPFITLGFTATVLLTALAITSFTALRRRMGQKWQTLHNAVYLIAILGVWHYWWQVKKDITEPLIYAAVLAVLLSVRIFWRWRRKKRQLRKNRYDA